MSERVAETVSKPLLVKILQWFYLLLALASLSGIFFYQNLSVVPSLGIANEFVIGFIVAIALYFLVIAISFFLLNTNFLILTLVLVFFTTIGALGMLGISLFNADALFSGSLPSCAANIATCNSKDGIIVASTALLMISIPILILNIITIVGAIKGIAATD